MLFLEATERPCIARARTNRSGSRPVFANPVHWIRKHSPTLGDLNDIKD